MQEVCDSTRTSSSFAALRRRGSQTLRSGNMGIDRHVQKNFLQNCLNSTLFKVLQCANGRYQLVQPLLIIAQAIPSFFFIGRGSSSYISFSGSSSRIFSSS